MKPFIPSKRTPLKKREPPKVKKKSPDKGKNWKMGRPPHKPVNAGETLRGKEKD